MSKVSVTAELDITDIYFDDPLKAKAAIMHIDRIQEDGDFTLDIITSLIQDLRKDYDDVDLRDFLKKLRKELK